MCSQDLGGVQGFLQAAHHDAPAIALTPDNKRKLRPVRTFQRDGDLGRLARPWHFPKPQAELINQVIIGEDCRHLVIGRQAGLIRRKSDQARQAFIDIMRTAAMDIQQQQKAAQRIAWACAAGIHARRFFVCRKPPAIPPLAAIEAACKAAAIGAEGEFKAAPPRPFDPFPNQAPAFNPRFDDTVIRGVTPRHAIALLRQGDARASRTPTAFPFAGPILRKAWQCHEGKQEDQGSEAKQF